MVHMEQSCKTENIRGRWILYGDPPTYTKRVRVRFLSIGMKSPRALERRVVVYHKPEKG